MYLFTMQGGVTIKRYFPEFFELLDQVSDHRKRAIYKVQELLMAVVGMFLFKLGSGNYGVNSATKGNYSRNFERLFGYRQLDLDTSNSLLKLLEPEESKEIKRRIVQLLLRVKVLEKYKLFGANHLIWTDACNQKITMS